MLVCGGIYRVKTERDILSEHLSPMSFREHCVAIAVYVFLPLAMMGIISACIGS